MAVTQISPGQMAAAINAVQARIAEDANSQWQPMPQPAATEAANNADGFSSLLQRAVHSVDAQDRVAGEKMAAVDAGRSDDLVGAMLASQQASLSFSMLMQARNKIVGAVEDLIKLPL